MSVLPTGTVTFLFTDIEGSIKQAQAQRSEWPALQARHHAILRAATEAHQGYVFQVIGDAFCVAFATAADALLAAVDAQRALQAEAWGETLIKVRMGLHTGAAEWRNGEYEGYLTLASVQRIMSVAHGGQILVSQTTTDLLRGQLRSGVTLRDLGQHRLKGLAESERLLQVVTPDLPSDFPALRSASGTPHNLPVQLTSFIGREKELAELRQRLAGTRLLTLTGSGGTGKTRLSLQLATELLSNFQDGAWLVELAPLTDPGLIPQTVASALGLREQPGQPLLEMLREHLRDKRLLLIVDNCEHLLEASARLVDALLHAAPDLKIVASSREGLGIAGETTYHVPSLPVPDLNGELSVSKLETYDAVRLFCERALAARASFVLNSVNAPAVGQICYRLDGIPLAIELAAARVRALPVESLAMRLDDRFRLLTGGSRTALPRQQTLRGTIDWSHSLLSEPERILLRRLSVFTGGWTIEAVEVVCAGEGIESDAVVDLLVHLVEKSLVVLDQQAAEPRYQMLETVRQYAREKLLGAGEGTRLRERHLEFYLALAEEAEPEFYGHEQVDWFNRLEAEHDNLRAAMEWSSQAGDAVSLFRLVGALYYFWYTHGYYGEGWERLQKAFSGDRVTNDTPRAALARARALLGLAFWWNFLAYNTDTRAAVEEALAIGVAQKDKLIIADAYRFLGRMAFRQGNYAESQSYFEQSVALYQGAKDELRVAWSRMFLGDLALIVGDYSEADNLYTQSIATFRALGNKTNLAYPLRRLGSVAIQQSDFGRARLLLNESIALNLEVGERQGLAACVATYAALYAARGQEQVAAKLFAAVDALLNSVHIKLVDADQSEFEHNLAVVRQQLDSTAFDATWTEGQSLTLEQAVVLAQQIMAEEAVQPESDAPEMPPDESDLTAREREVLRLLAEGMSNQEIAARLVISVFTVRAHLRAIYGKLGVTTRSAATRYALEHHLV